MPRPPASNNSVLESVEKLSENMAKLSPGIFEKKN